MIPHTDEYHAESLIITQGFSVGHFWSPHHTITASIFCKLHITTNNSISYRYSASIGYKMPHFHTVRSIWTAISNKWRISAPVSFPEKS